ncbi:MAG: HAD hydrolase-like protein, partial [Bacilli bacterium]|nr:HAD hydrolase-like protein [Bacilli bacterium]
MAKHFIFDLDGTLLDTIEDICFAINTALGQCGYSHRYDRESTKTLVGDGAEALMHRALREKGNDPEAFAELKPIYMRLYRDHQTEHARPFDGLKETLIEMKRRGATFCCVTNKPDPLAQTILDMHFGKGFFDMIIGARTEFPVKPDPA